MKRRTHKKREGEEKKYYDLKLTCVSKQRHDGTRPLRQPYWLAQRLGVSMSV